MDLITEAIGKVEKMLSAKQLLFRYSGITVVAALTAANMPVVITTYKSLATLLPEPPTALGDINISPLQGRNSQKRRKSWLI
jgi:hypothetical protein